VVELGGDAFDLRVAPGEQLALDGVVTIDDGTDSASADFTVFLVLRDDGWKVWGVY
jgi:hypothetical protein